MHWLSKGVDVLVRGEDRGREFDVVVVGSGYGGAVAALRLQEAGYSVCVLERGEEFRPGEFPNDIANIPKYVRLERRDSPQIMGRRDGLFDIRMHGRVTTLVGNALGGTSHINANVAFEPDVALFENPPWPQALRQEADRLPGYYAKARGILGENRYTKGSIKADQLKRLQWPLAWRLPLTEGWNARAKVYRAPLSINVNPAGVEGLNPAGVKQHDCVGCGDCVTGCNWAAKNSLTMNYLPLAYKLGAEFYTGATVLAVAPRHGDGAMVFFAYTNRDLRDIVVPAQEAWWREFEKPEKEKKLFRLHAKFVVLAAGALGSTEILLRSAELGLLRKSPKLGRNFSTNGDALHFGFGQDRPVNAIGLGADPSRYSANGARPAPGPTIVSVLDVRTGKRPQDRILIEDGIVPGPLAHMTHELLAASAMLTQLDKPRMRGDGDPLALSDEALRHTQVYLAMGHDSARGRIQLKAGRAFVAVPKNGDAKCSRLQEKCLRLVKSKLKGLFLRNPTLFPVPKAITDMLSGPSIQGSAIVVHPLGGCPMGESFATGVVDDTGAVFSGDDHAATHPSLYVWDGSVMPCALGVNPFLTITALAERAAEQMIKRHGAPGARGEVRELPTPDPRLEPPRDLPPRSRVGVHLKETMRGNLAWHGAGAAPDAIAETSLQLEIPVDDVVALFGSARRRIGNVSGEMKLGALQARAIAVQGGIELLQPETRSWWQSQKDRFRTLSVWWRKRGRAELRQERRKLGREIPNVKKIWNYVIGLWRFAYHCSETRYLRYDLRFTAANQTYRLLGTKTVRYAVDSNVWDALLDLHTVIRREGDPAPIAQGVLRLDLLDLAERGVPEIVAATDLPNALAALASLPLFFLRVMLKLHLWDFKAPDYAPTTPLPSAGEPFDYVEVPNGKNRIVLPLTRLPRSGPPEALKREDRMPVLLLHGYAQSSYAFMAPHLPEDLVRHLCARNFDVWLLDYRTSTALPSNREQCTLDDVARFDVPAAVRKILDITGKEQLMAFGHCMGAATLAMSLLAGHLRNPRTGKSLVSAAVLSQVPPFIVGGFYSQYRRQLAAFYRDVLGLKGIQFNADDNAKLWESLMDRLLGTLPMAIEPSPYGKRFPERCEDFAPRMAQDPRTDIATCKRVSGIIGPLYLHKNVTQTHDCMHHYFGFGSVSVLSQVGKFFEYEQLVTADGSNVYTSDENIRRHLDFPIALLHGKRNQVFDPESSERTLKRINSVRSDQPCVALDIPDDYAHFDCLVGDNAHREVFPKVSEFFLKAYAQTRQ